MYICDVFCPKLVTHANLYLYFFFQAKQRASIKWLLSKAYDHRTPEELKEPFYKNHDVSHFQDLILTWIHTLIRVWVEGRADWFSENAKNLLPPCINVCLNLVMEPDIRYLNRETNLSFSSIFDDFSKFCSVLSMRVLFEFGAWGPKGLI